MGAMTLLVDQRGAELTLSKNTQTICLHYPDGKTHRVGIYALGKILVYGEVNLSAAVIRACNTAEVSLIFLPGGKSKGDSFDIFPYVNHHLQLRLAQYRAYFDKEVCLSLARQIVTAKIEAQSSWLAQHNLGCDFSSSLADVRLAPNNATLMGLEGSVSRQYLVQWRSLWDEVWGFKERNRRPPLDPVNALLSLSYTMAGNSVGRLASTYGLDVGLGFLHVPQSNRPSLALDILEPVRPWVDQWLWQKVQEGLFTPKHFYQSNSVGCRLDKTGRGFFFTAWYNDAEPYIQSPMRDSLANVLRILRQYRILNA